MNASTAEIETLHAAYHTLDVDVRASVRAIRARYRELARYHHPDKWPAGSPEQERAGDRMRRINAAFELIQSAPLRERAFADAFDRRPNAAPGRSTPGGVMGETASKFTVGAVLGGFVAMSLYGSGVPGVSYYAPILIVGCGLTSAIGSRHAVDLLSVLWWW